MCGISGFLSKDKIKDLLALEKSNNILQTRGPDASGTYSDAHLFLGHRRLSIIDLNTGAQPMYSDGGMQVIVYNGEIYNFKKIRQELQREGRVFKTESDTEVIIEGYLHWGLSIMLSKLEGMFAFALYDKSIEKLFIARDRFGEKPLYYFWTDTGFYFASELKAITHVLEKKEIDITALNLYLTLTYIPAPYTIYKGVSKLLPGHFIELDKNPEVKVSQYYSLKDRINSGVKYNSYETAKSDLRSLLFDSVWDRMISDVPLGSFLSGGIDSSIVTAIMAEISPDPVHTFSIGFKEKAYDESSRASLVSAHLKTKHSSFIVDYKDLLDCTDDAVDYFDEPFADSSAIPSYLVAKMASQHVKVVLTGDCADELFGGYEKYLAPYYAAKYSMLPGFIKAPVKALVGITPHNSYTNVPLRKIKKLIRNSSESPFDMHYNFMSLGFNETSKPSLLKPDFQSETRQLVKSTFDTLEKSSDMDKGFYTDIKCVLEGDMLTKVDRMCMRHSLEARVPFLDSSIVDASFRMPGHYKIEGSNKKKILKETFADLLPKEVFSFKKKGFGVPLTLWFRNELKSELLQVLNSESIEKQGIFNSKYIQSLIDEHMSGKENHASQLWVLYVFQKWYFKNFQP